jgi:ATP-binding cassette subfamily F protein 3
MLHQDINLRLNAAKRSGDIVLRTADLAVGYPPHRPLIRSDDLQVLRGDRIAILGGNGVGKTTLLRTMLGELPPLAGQVRLGASVQLGYLSQTHDNLDPDLTAIQTIVAVRPTELTGEQARNLLGAFLFTGENVFKRVGDLSGGERSRVVLARLALEGANVLIMDEPTNHLDIASQEILQDVLEEYEGTVIFVSHDRYLIGQLATDIWVIRDHGVKVIGGGWDKFLRWREREAQASQPEIQQMQKAPKAPVAAKTPAKAAAKAPPRPAKPRKLDRRKVDMLQNKIKSTEDKVHTLEKRLAELSEAISQASVEGEFKEINQKADDYQAADAQLKRLYSQWEELNSDLAKLLETSNPDKS